MHCRMGLLASERGGFGRPFFLCLRLKREYILPLIRPPYRVDIYFQNTAPIFWDDTIFP